MYRVLLVTSAGLSHLLSWTDQTRTERSPPKDGQKALNKFPTPRKTPPREDRPCVSLAGHPIRVSSHLISGKASSIQVTGSVVPAHRVSLYFVLHESQDQTPRPVPVELALNGFPYRVVHTEQLRSPPYMFAHAGGSTDSHR